MNIYISLKSLAKRKNFITKQPYELQKKPNTLRELITQVVTQNFEQFNNKASNPETPLINFLSHSDIEQQIQAGKVGFQTLYNDKQANLARAIEIAIQAFEDGLYRMFINDEEAEQLDTPLEVTEDAEVVFIRLTMLTGLMW
ncbi:hypothetical protein [Neobacillus massiliamazoniensis]|uniref:Uncharacterized protein n=1 Tax=Neobacillus massiliamazoniensis TaxID=1499688 RepID=A0A0U1P3F5_9BACI|nr:hypothetical protein [Neobacillus massiliamazoniensis]CRK84777.1 hypothetical protein BN000_04827 [Neobacillus massiliamazoniensis]